MNKNKKSGFTLIELTIAMALFGIVFGTISYMIISAMNARYESKILDQMVILAKTKMNEVKKIVKEDSQQKEFDAWPEYTYQYSVNEVEVDLLGFNDQIESSPLDKFKKSNTKRDSVTGGIVKLLHYVVTIKHKSGASYSLDFYRSAINL